MSRPTLISVGLLSAAVVCITVGVFLTFGLGVALIVFGALLAAADLLVPNRTPAR